MSDIKRIKRRDLLDFVASVEDYCTEFEMNRRIGIFCLKIGEGYKQLYINDVEIDLKSIDSGSVYNFILYINFNLQ